MSKGISKKICISLYLTAVSRCISQGISKKICPKSADHVAWCCKKLGKVDAGIAAGFSCGIGFVAMLACIPMLKWIRNKVEEDLEREARTSSRHHHHHHHHRHHHHHHRHSFIRRARRRR